MPLRPVTPSDAETVALHRYPEEVDAAEQPIYAGWVAGAVERGVYQGFFIEKEGEVVAGAGLVRLEWGPSRGDPQAYRARLVNLWTHPDWRRRGLGRAVVQACLNAAQEQAVKVVNLSTTAMARPLYESLGFQASPAEMRLKLP